MNLHCWRRPVVYCKECIRALTTPTARAIFPWLAPGRQRSAIHNLQPGNCIYWKYHLYKDDFQPRWKGPCEILLTNPCAAKLRGIDSQIHVSHLKKIPTPTWSSQPTEDLKLKISERSKTTTRIFTLDGSRWHLIQRALPRLGPGQSVIHDSTQQSLHLSFPSSTFVSFTDHIAITTVCFFLNKTLFVW